MFPITAWVRSLCARLIPAPQRQSTHEIAFERLESRCLMTATLEEAIFAPLTIRPPSAHESPLRAYGIFRSLGDHQEISVIRRGPVESPVARDDAIRTQAAESTARRPGRRNDPVNLTPFQERHDPYGNKVRTTSTISDAPSSNDPCEATEERVIHLRRQPTEGGNSTIPTDRADTPPQTAIPSLPGSPINDCDFAFAHDGNSSWIPRDIAAALAIGNGASDESDRPNGAEQARIEDEAFINWIEACDAAPLPLEVSVEPVSAASLAANADLPSQSAAPLAANPVARQATLAMSLVLASPTLKENGATGSRRRKRSGVTWIEFAAQFLLTPRPDEPHQPTVLIAMSEDQARDQLSVALASEGYLVLTARDTHDAWEQLRASFTPIDVAVVDVDLDLSVVHLQRKIRELYPRLPVILCTSDLNHPDMTQLQGLGVAHCFVKPLALGELLATVDSLAS